MSFECKCPGTPLRKLAQASRGFSVDTGHRSIVRLLADHLPVSVPEPVYIQPLTCADLLHSTDPSRASSRASVLPGDAPDVVCLTPTSTGPGVLMRCNGHGSPHTPHDVPRMFEPDPEQRRVEAMQRELLVLRRQVQVLQDIHNQRQKLDKLGSSQTASTRTPTPPSIHIAPPPPPPPPAPPLPPGLLASAPSNALNSGAKKPIPAMRKRQLPVEDSSTPSNPEQTRRRQSIACMGDVLRDMSNVKLKHVDIVRSPGGTPVRSVCHAGDDTLAGALRRKFAAAHQAADSSGDGDTSLLDASAASWMSE